MHVAAITRLSTSAGDRAALAQELAAITARELADIRLLIARPLPWLVAHSAEPDRIASIVQRLRAAGGAGDSLRTIMYAGEPFPVPSLRRLMRQLPHVTFFNFFGPTETTEKWVGERPMTL